MYAHLSAWSLLVLLVSVWVLSGSRALSATVQKHACDLQILDSLNRLFLCVWVHTVIYFSMWPWNELATCPRQRSAFALWQLVEARAEPFDPEFSNERVLEVNGWIECVHKWKYTITLGKLPPIHLRQSYCKHHRGTTDRPHIWI